MTPHVNHLRDHWFDGKAPYWPGLTDAASDFAKGLADALELMIPNAKAPKVLPLDCYWLAHGNTFTVVAELDTNAQTVRMIVITPKPNP